MNNRGVYCCVVAVAVAVVVVVVVVDVVDNDDDNGDNGDDDDDDDDDDDVGMGVCFVDLDPVDGRGFVRFILLLAMNFGCCGGLDSVVVSCFLVGDGCCCLFDVLGLRRLIGARGLVGVWVFVFALAVVADADEECVCFNFASGVCFNFDGIRWLVAELEEPGLERVTA